MPTHLRLFLGVLGLIFLLSCSSSKTSENDSDVLPDTDTDSQDVIVDDDADSEEDLDFVDDSEETPDQDNDENVGHDADHNIIPDTDSDEDVACLDLRYNENTIKTPFPFKDANGKPTFCRPGCDTPTDNDPQCVRNIWDWDNWGEYQDYLKEQEKNQNQTKERECYPWPCKLPDMHAKTKAELNTFISSCDRLLTVNDFSANDGTVWSHGMSDGVAGMSFGHSTRVVEYDPKKDEYSTLGHSYYVAFNENRYVIQSYDRDPNLDANAKFFVVSVLRQNGNYHYEFIYDLTVKNEKFSDPPFAGKNWVLLRLEGKKTIYASAKDWKWHELAGINNYAGEGNIVGDHLTFITNNRELYYCDLRKYPQHIDDCFKLNRKNESGNEELGHSPRIDLDDEYRVVYNVYGKPTFVEVSLKDLESPKYSEHAIDKNKETTYSWEIDMLKGNRISYSDFFTLLNGTTDEMGCFYRFDRKESYCPSDSTFVTHSSDLMGFNVFGGKWHLWKITTSIHAIMRDWECYCKENNVCPLEQ